jgi:hypothetical protein
MPMDEEDRVVLDPLVVDGNFRHSTLSCVARAGSAMEELYGSPPDIDGMIFAWFRKRKKNKKEEVGQRSWDFIAGSTFLYGIKALADYVHVKSLKLGINSDARISTCQGRPGSLFHENNDAEQFASWGVVQGPLINEAAVKRVEGQGLIFAKPEFFLGDKEEVRGEG